MDGLQAEVQTPVALQKRKSSLPERQEEEKPKGKVSAGQGTSYIINAVFRSGLSFSGVVFLPYIQKTGKPMPSQHFGLHPMPPFRFKAHKVLYRRMTHTQKKVNCNLKPYHTIQRF